MMVADLGIKWCFKISMSILLIVTGSIGFSQQVEKVTPKGTKFLLYTPPGYSPANGQYPLLVMLPGQGGIGDDLNLLLTHRDIIPAKLIAQNQWPARYPFIVVTPQLKRDPTIINSRDQLWPPELVDEVIEHVQSGYAVNKNKIYVTGLSLGAHGVYSYAAEFPEKVAAMVMISGVPDTLLACQIKNIPVWTFHGSDDFLVDPVFATSMVRLMTECTPKGKFTPHLTLQYGRSHEGWNEVYSNSIGFDVYEWMLKFTKNDTRNTPPYVNAGNDLNIIKREQPLHLYGEYFDSDGSIRNVSWKKISGPSVTLDNTQSRLLKLSNAVAGDYEFELSVTDDDGAQASDRVRLHMADGNASLPFISEITLINGESQQVIGRLHDGYVINPKVLGTNQINLRASVSGNARSVRFRINGNQDARTTNSVPFSLANPRWTADEGEYLVCATPYSGLTAQGAQGFSQCFKIVISTGLPPSEEGPDEEEPEEEEEEAPEAKHFYAKAGSDISLLSSWESRTNGTVTSPTSFSAKDVTYEIQTKVTLNNPLVINGAGAVLRVLAGGELTLNNRLDATVNMEGNAILQVNTDSPIKLGTLSPTSTVHYNATVTIPAAHFGNLYMKGAGTVKTLSPGITKVYGNITIDDGVKVEGAAASSSTLALSGTLDLLEKKNFLPARPFTIVFEKGSGQAFNLKPNQASFSEMVVHQGTTVQVYGDSNNTILNLGSDAGGGLTVASGATLVLNENNLHINGKGSINRLNETGQVGFRKSHLKILSASPSDSHLYTLAGSDSLETLVTDLGGSGAFNVHGPLFIVDHVNTVRGNINSNGFISLVSTPDKTARLMKPGGNGRLSGDINFQRFIKKGRQTRYISLPVAGVTVEEIQRFIPVSGNFDGASGGSGTTGSASLFYYDDAQDGWSPFPKLSNTETLSVGKGYSLLMPEDNTHTKLIMTGPIHQGDYTFAVSGNTGNDPEKGWNLIGNPYASPVAWDPARWASEGVNATAYLYDGSYPGGRFLVWDGHIGDEEFSGMVAQGQGFFVRTTASTPVLKITAQAMVDSSFHLVRQQETATSSQFLSVTLRQDQLIDRAYIKFTRQGADHFDETDALKLTNGYFSLSTLSSDSIALAINNVSETFCDRSIALSLQETKPGKYSLVFDGPLLEDNTIKIKFVDQFTNTTQELRPDMPYTFQVTADPASYGRKRFRIQMPSSTIPDPVITAEENLLTSNIPSGNQWIFDGELIEGATGPVLAALFPGAYQLQISIDGCRKISAPVYVTATITDIYENRNKDLRSYPNPASSYIQLQSASPPVSTTYYSIVNALGMEVMKGQIEPAVLVQGSAIDVQHLPPGIYYLIIPGMDYQNRFVIH